MFFEISYLQQIKSILLAQKTRKTSLEKGAFCSVLNIKMLIISFLKGGTVRDHIQIRVGLRPLINFTKNYFPNTSETISRSE
jgi:hypothetical protein